MQAGTFMKLDGEVKVDEAFIGGKARNMRVAQRQRRITGTGGADKTVVMGIVSVAEKSERWLFLSTSPAQGRR